MKNINLSFSTDDIKAISCALSILPAYDFFDSFPTQLISLPANIILKLNKRKKLSNQEIYLIAIAVDSAEKALCDEISVEDDAVSELRQHSSTIKKLASLLSPLLDSE